MMAVSRRNVYELNDIMYLCMRFIGFLLKSEQVWVRFGVGLDITG
jgi:hypothetical protein